jgi:hypothetical protein
MSSAFNIVAVTRSTTSKSAQALASHPNAFLVEGDLDNPAAIFKQISSIWVSLVSGLDLRVLAGGDPRQSPRRCIHREWRQPPVYTSGDRGGSIDSLNNPTTVGNFAAKDNVEEHLGKEAAASAHGMTYTILRPVAFFENQTLD